MIIATIERKNGTTYEQMIAVLTNVREAIEDLKTKLGKDYWIIDWRWA